MLPSFRLSPVCLANFFRNLYKFVCPHFSPFPQIIQLPLYSGTNIAVAVQIDRGEVVCVEWITVIGIEIVYPLFPPQITIHLRPPIETERLQLEQPETRANIYAF
jgi:hypothetical protein